MIESKFFTLANGMRLHAEVSGPGSDAPTIIFLHGFPEYSGMWRRQLTHFGGKYRCVAPDQRGYNLSSKPSEVKAYRAKTLVEDVVQLADALQCKKFTLVAHDWGGAIAWNVAAWHPDRVERLIIFNAPHPITFMRELKTNPAQVEASTYMTLFRSEKAERVLAEDNYRRLKAMTLDAWSKNGGSASAEDIEGYVNAWSQPGALTGMLNWYRASPLHPPEPNAPLPDLDPTMFHVSVPTTVVWGEMDRALLPGNLKGLRDHVDTIKIIRVSDASHWIVHERTSIVIDCIEESLRAN